MNRIWKAHDGRGRRVRAALFSGALLALSACEQVVPGLNVPLGAEGVHPMHPQGQPAERPQWPPYGPSRVPPPPSAVPDPAAPPLERYEIVRVTPAVVARLARASVAADATADLPVVSPADVPPEYRIGPGDVLFVTVWEHPEFSQPVGGDSNDSAEKNGRIVGLAEREGRLVGADGSMYYPYLGNLHVAGLSIRELRESIQRGLTPVVVDPKVDVKVIAYRAHRVQVSGEVQNPGTVVLDDTPKGILEAIDASGGLTTAASRRRVTLLRGERSYRIDLAALLSGDAPGRNVKLLPGDRIQVPNAARDNIYVLGEVNDEKPVQMHDSTMPLVEALSSSGGLNKLGANDSGVLVFRLNAPGTDIAASVYAIDMASAEGMLMASQFPLRERDVVYVMATALSKYNAVVEQILPTVHTMWYGNDIERNHSNF